MLEITSIKSIARQGRTRPLICLADNGVSYVVKYSSGVTVNGLVKEWLAGRLAQAFGFNVPEFVPAFLCKELIDGYTLFEKNDVIPKPVEGVVFASKIVEFVDFENSNIKNVPIASQQDLLLFDLWIQNEDRNLSETGGNVNLLWSLHQNDYIVIDHNLAFDSPLDNDFLSMHVFRQSVGEFFQNDWVTQEMYEQKLQKILEKWDNYLSECPKEWLESDLFNLDLTKVYQQLLADANGALWGKLK